MLETARAIVRASRLTYRRQQAAATDLNGIVANFRRYLKQPSRVLDVAANLARSGRWDEFDQLTRDTDLLFLEGKRPLYLHDLSHIEKRIVFETASLAAQSAESVAQLVRSVEYIVKAGIPGDFVECGVYRGGSIVAIIRTLQHLNVTDRKIWLYDTFEGFPEPEAIDKHYVETPAEDGGLKSWELHKRDDGSGGSDWCYCSIDDVKRTVLATGYPQDNLVFVKGMVEDTIPAQSPASIALLRLDTDFYRSTRHELDHLYPRLVAGGVLILDDYGAYSGARQAVDEYFGNAPILLSRVDENVRLATKLGTA